MGIKKSLLLSFSILALTPSIAFAKDVQLSGKISDNNNNPIPQGVVLIQDASGKDIKAATTNTDGLYQLTIPEGTYNISVGGQKESPYTTSSYPAQIFNSDVTRDFVLTTPTIKAAVKKTSKLPTITKILAMIVIIAGVAGAVALFIRSRKESTSA